MSANGDKNDRDGARRDYYLTELYAEAEVNRLIGQGAVRFIRALCLVFVRAIGRPVLLAWRDRGLNRLLYVVLFAMMSVASWGVLVQTAVPTWAKVCFLTLLWGGLLWSLRIIYEKDLEQPPT